MNTFFNRLIGYLTVSVLLKFLHRRIGRMPTIALESENITSEK